MLDKQNFDNFKVQNPLWETDLEVYQLDSGIYKRAVFHWNENESLHHEYHACVNVETGDVFMDCSPQKLFLKHLSLLISRPFHTYAKTCWHLSVLGPVVMGLLKVYEGKMDGSQFLTYMGHSFEDIVRSPLYGIALTITHLVAVVWACFDPHSLYYTRDIVGQLERKLLRVEHIKYADGWVFSNCFSPIYNIGRKNPESGEYRKIETVKSELDDFVRRRVEYCRRIKSLFDNCFIPLDPSVEYRSPASV